MTIKNIRLKDGTPCASVHEAVAKFKCPGPCDPDCALHPMKQVPGTDSHAHMCHPQLVAAYPFSVLDAMGCSYETVVGEEAPERHEGYAAVIRSGAVRDAQVSRISEADPLSDEWEDCPEAEVWLGFFYGPKELVLDEAAKFGCTAPENIRLMPLSEAMAGAPPKEIQMRSTGYAGADCYNYAVRIPKTATLKGFIEMIWQERKSESGEIYVSANLAEASVTNNVGIWKYENGVPTEAPHMPETQREALENRRIRTIRATGGWGRMTWYLSLEPGTKTETEVQDA